MSGRVILGGRQGKINAAIGSSASGEPGLKVYNEDIFSRSLFSAFLTDELGSNDLAQSNLAVSDPTLIHNGGDTAAFTATALSGAGRWDFADTAQAFSGSASVGFDNARNNDVASFTNATDLPIEDITSLDMRVYLTQWPTTGSIKEVQVRVYLNGNPISDIIPLSSYLNIATLNSWQLVSIPQSAMNLSANTWDEIRITVRDQGQGQAPRGFLDDIIAQGPAATGIINFSFGPASDREVEVDRIRLSAASTANKIKYDEFLGIPALSNGLNLSVIRGGKVDVQRTIFDNFNFLELASTNLDADFDSGGTALFVADLDLRPFGLRLNGSSNDQVQFTVRDDLSSLLRFTASVEGYFLTRDFKE